MILHQGKGLIRQCTNTCTLDAWAGCDITKQFAKSVRWDKSKLYFDTNHMDLVREGVKRGTGSETAVGFSKEIREKIWTDGDVNRNWTKTHIHSVQNARSCGGGEQKGSFIYRKSRNMKREISGFASVSGRCLSCIFWRCFRFTSGYIRSF